MSQEVTEVTVAVIIVLLYMSQPKVAEVVTQFDLQPHMQSELWPDIRKGIDQHLGKIYTKNKSSLKGDYWICFHLLLNWTK
uniref:Uncharacterized protein n=1 Tax=Tanacetum cinerariifolium TaxID=118510 RepID=A0A6L2K0Q5_TANCI|nr:hypothetical protein [Tanacetum cinerariifolium]